MLRLSCFPVIWKLFIIILIHNPSKPTYNVASSYRPITISLLPVLAKLFEKLVLKRIKPIVN